MLHTVPVCFTAGHTEVGYLAEVLQPSSGALYVTARCGCSLCSIILLQKSENDQ